jgi:hypothetical protein
MRWSIVQNPIFAIVLSALVCSAQGAPPSSPNAGQCPVLPSDNIWNVPVDQLPVDANSQAYLVSGGQTSPLHPNFGSGTYDGDTIGMPVTIVPGTQPRVSVTFADPSQSDNGPYPIPPDVLIEGGTNSTGDRHALVLDKDNCVLYELYDATPNPDGSWNAGSGAIFDLRCDCLRPETWTSADAAGLPIYPGLVRYDEAASGVISHAIRVTLPQTQRAYIWPARHYASTLTALTYPPMGQRFRLKADVDITGYDPLVQVILVALKRYGMILADNGSSWFICGTPDERWNNDTLAQLKQLQGSDFEAVDSSSLMVAANSGRAAVPSRVTQ